MSAPTGWTLMVLFIALPCPGRPARLDVLHDAHNAQRDRDDREAETRDLALHRPRTQHEFDGDDDAQQAEDRSADHAVAEPGHRSALHGMLIPSGGVDSGTLPARLRMLMSSSSINSSSPASRKIEICWVVQS